MKKLLLAGIILFSNSVIAQNIGIGTNSPQAKLDITASNSGLLIPRLTAAQKAAIGLPPKGLMVYDSTSNSINYYNGNQWVDLSPAAPSNMWLTNPIGSDVTLFNNSTQYRRVFIGSQAIQDVSSYTNTPDGALTITHKAQAPSTSSYYLTMDGQNIQARSQPGLFDPQVNANLLINRFGGNLGLGTTDPSHARFEVNGSVGAVVAMFGADKYGIAIEADNPEIGFNYYYNSGAKTIKAGFGANLGMDPYNGNLYIGNFSGNQSSVDHGNIIGYQNVMTINQNGNVGIGTTNPTYKLSVNGQIQSKEIRVESGWSDYVFEKKYYLRPLTEVEAFVKKFQHLPGIPSAKEIQENGLPLAEMNTKMMEKIEELTLYIIELNKKVIALEKALSEKKPISIENEK